MTANLAKEEWYCEGMMKIHIIGGPGSGKSFLAEKLSKELGISHFDLDDLQWDNKSASYGVKRSPDERDRLLNDVTIGSLRASIMHGVSNALQMRIEFTS